MDKGHLVTILTKPSKFFFFKQLDPLLPPTTHTLGSWWNSGSHVDWSGEVHLMLCITQWESEKTFLSGENGQDLLEDCQYIVDEELK